MTPIAKDAAEQSDEDLPGMLALAIGVAEQRWPHTMDAQVWVDEWTKAIADKPEIAADQGAMLCWFANAIMAGYDTAQSRFAEQLAAVRREGALAAIEEMMPLLYDYTGLRLGFGPIETRRPTHGWCCTCQECGFAHDACICEHNEIYDKVQRLRARYEQGEP